MTALSTARRLVFWVPRAPARPAGAARSRRRRIVRSLLNQWITHLTLLTLAALFVFPFFWMLGMSLKTDEEATSATAMPEMPRFRTASPYVLPPDAVDRPEMAPRDRWQRLYPQLKSIGRSALEKVPVPAGTFEADATSLRESAAVEAVGRGIEWVSEKSWAAPNDDAEIIRQFTQGLAGAGLPAVLEGRLARLELGGIQVRSLSGHVKPVVQDGTLWTVRSGDAQLIPIESAGVQAVRYRFANSSAAPIVLRADFDAAIAADELHRLLVSYKGDGSWNHIDVELQLGDQRYVSAQTTYIAQHRGASLLLQPPTFQDQTLGARTWVNLRPAGTVAGAVPRTRATLTLTLWPSSTPRAMWGKFQRNFSRALRSMPFWTYVGNSLVIVVLQVAGALFSSGFVGYAFARLHWPGRSAAMGILLATMMLPSQVTMIPSFLIWRELGWYNTLNPLWIGAWMGNAFFIFLMVQHMRTIPRELDDAARIDGMNAFEAWWYVIMPQVKPTLAAIAILTFMGAWNEFMQPLILLRDQTKFPLSLGLYAIRLDANADWPLIMASNLLMTLPVIVIFFLFQRYFIEGVTVSGLKG